MNNPTFRPYQPRDLIACLGLFDDNCPESFAPNERAEYETFLANHAATYEVCVADGAVVGAYGLQPRNAAAWDLRWIIVARRTRRSGTGTAILERVRADLTSRGVRTLHIAASHVSAPFFARFGAKEITTTPDGWGPGMHRIDMEIAL